MPRRAVAKQKQNAIANLKNNKKQIQSNEPVQSISTSRSRSGRPIEASNSVTDTDVDVRAIEAAADVQIALSKSKSNSKSKQTSIESPPHARPSRHVVPVCARKQYSSADSEDLKQKNERIHEKRKQMEAEDEHEEGGMESNEEFHQIEQKQPMEIETENENEHENEQEKENEKENSSSPNPLSNTSSHSEIVDSSSTPPAGQPNKLTPNGNVHEQIHEDQLIEMEDTTDEKEERGHSEQVDDENDENQQDEQADQQQEQHEEDEPDEQEQEQEPEQEEEEEEEEPPIVKKKSSISNFSGKTKPISSQDHRSNKQIKY
jgi:hypothetical protein